ncbi:MAG: hypothetical protein EPO68_07255 [Planctomycetota bacterium]|nr:MAG: hypothetical protein EPO68_07255 [Planctomycetota bacterium]
MNSRASAVLALAAIGLLLLGAWWWLRAEPAVANVDARDAAPTAESEPQRASLEPTAVLGDPEVESDEVAEIAHASRVAVGGPDASAIRVRLRSSVGLPLLRVEVRGSDALWQPHAVVGGVATLASAALPLEARAPGHAARRFESLGASIDGAYELLLDPESLVVIDDPTELLTSGALPHASGDAPLRDLAALLSHGPIGARKYALAFDSERLVARRMHELELGFGMRSCWTLQCKVRLEKGLRAHGELPAETAVRSHAPLVVRVHPDSPRRGPWTLRIELASKSNASWIRADLGDHVVGNLQANPSSFAATEYRTDAVWKFDNLLMERDYSYALFDHATGASAMGTLRHLGQPIELRLNAGCVVTGRVAVPAGATSPASIDVTVQWSEPPSKVKWRTARSMWNSQSLAGVPLAPDGSFQFACFDGIPDGYDGLGLLSVQIETDEFASGGRELEVVRAQRHDLGVVELAAAAPGITLAPKSNYSPHALFKTWASAAGVEQDVIRTLERPDGSLLVRTAQPIDARELALRWITESRHRGHVFLAREGGVYHPAQVQRRHIELAIEQGPDPDRFWRLALDWHGASVDLDEVRATQAGEVLVRRYDVPDGTRLAWTAHRQLNAGVSPPLEPSRSVALDVPAGAPPARAVLR